MDPFAPDSENDEENISAHHSSRQRRSTSASSQKSHHSVHQRALSDNGDDEGPPPSIVLDTHGLDDNEDRNQPETHESLDHTLSLESHPLPMQVSESVRLARLGKRRANSTSNRGSDEDEDVEGIPEDEEAGLMGLQQTSRVRKHRHSHRKGLLSRMIRKVQQGAESIITEDQQQNKQSTSDPTRHLTAKDRALWNWGTLENMDEFLQEVYNYYTGKGLACIILTKVLNLLTIAFVIGFSSFLVGCIDYSAIKHDSQLSDVIVGHCISRSSGITLLLFAVLVGLYAWQVVRFSLGISKLMAMHRFYTHLLNVPDADVQSIPWSEIVARIVQLRKTQPVTSLSSTHGSNGERSEKLDAQDIANRIMRQENYLVALFNKDVLDLNVPVPGLSRRAPQLTKTLEWNLTFCLLGYLFDSEGKVRQPFVSEVHRQELIEGLKRRFLFMAIVNAIFAPFIVLYLLFYSFFRYFEEYHKNPSHLGSRQYTQYARWKFREFNELPHLFRRRCHNSYPFAQRYIDQFPKERTAIIARFVSFIAGSFTAVLLLASVVQPDLFVHFDITPHRNVLFYIGVFGAILAVSRALVPDDQQVFEPDILLRTVIEYTHYCPENWKGRFHSAEVHNEFSDLYKLKLSIFFSEILSVLFTPFILWKSLPNSAPAIIDFFREFTVHVDGLGYVCSFALFDFKRHGNIHFGAPHRIQDHRMSSKEGKMEQSLLGFYAANPTWQPTDPTASMFLSRLATEHRSSQNENLSHNLSAPPSNVHHTSADLTGPPGSVHPSTHLNFTPANSVLAQRSQLYNDAFERSILLASKPSNTLPLQGSTVRKGQRSTARGNGLQAVEEDGNDTLTEASDPLDSTSLSTYQDIHPAHVPTSDPFKRPFQPKEDVDLKGLLQHIGGRRW